MCDYEFLFTRESQVSPARTQARRPDARPGLQFFTAGQYAEALEAWTLAADAGDARSALFIGMMYDTGQGMAADTNVAFPLILALCVFILFTYEGFRSHGFIGFFKSLLPGGLSGAMVPLIFGIECLSYFLRLISLTVRLWANLLAGHMLIAFMGGELGVLVGDPWVQWLLLPLGIAIYAFEAVLIASLQAFIFSILTAIYLGDAVTSH